MPRYGGCSCSPGSVTASIRLAAWMRPWPVSGCKLDATQVPARSMCLLAATSRSGSARPTVRRMAIVLAVPGAQLSLLEFPADDPERARRFWAALLGGPLEPRHDTGEGWQTHSATSPVGLHARGRGPGD